MRRGILRLAGRPAAPGDTRSADGAAAPRLGPGDDGGIMRIHVGSGPHNLLADWWNVDIRPFRGVDEVMDVTRPWPWSGLDYVFGEHFLEHLAPEDAVAFVVEAGRHLRPGGRIRLSTPAIEHLWRTTFPPGPVPDERVVDDTLRANRFFHGWGHRFMWSRPLLRRLLDESGFEAVSFHAYGESDDANLVGLERHGGDTVTADGWPSVWNVEAVRGARPIEPPPALLAELEREVSRHVRSGH
jgi:predicted SAM-dependent methyltransferase